MKKLLIPALILLSFNLFGQDINKADTLKRPFEQLSLSDTLDIDTSQVVQEERFLQQAKEAIAEVRFKGFVRVNTFYDFQGIKNTEGFNPYEIIQDTIINQQIQGFFIGARQSRVGFESKIKTPIGLLQTYIEGDFAGDATGMAFRLRHAYGKLQYWTIGHTWSTFTDLEAIPFTVDRDGPNSLTYVRQGLIRYERSFANKYETALSIENPSKDFVNPFDTLNQDLQRDLDFNGRFKYNGKFGHIQLAFSGRILSYTSAFGQKEFAAGGGIMISGKLSTGKKGTVYFTAITGKGIARYLGGLEGKREDAFPNTNGQLDLLSLWSSTIAYEYDWSDALYSTITSGIIDMNNTAAQPENAFKQSLFGSFNTTMLILPNFDIAGEVAVGRRLNKNELLVSALRIQFMAQFRF